MTRREEKEIKKKETFQIRAEPFKVLWNTDHKSLYNWIWVFILTFWISSLFVSSFIITHLHYFEDVFMYRQLHHKHKNKSLLPPALFCTTFSNFLNFSCSRGSVPPCCGKHPFSKGESCSLSVQFMTPENLHRVK